MYAYAVLQRGYLIGRDCQSNKKTTDQLSGWFNPAVIMCRETTMDEFNYAAWTSKASMQINNNRLCAVVVSIDMFRTLIK